MDYPFTPIPNWWFPLVKHLSFAENKIMQCVWYNTVGYPGEAEGSRRDVSTITYDVIQDFTGIANRQTIFRALKKLEARKLIERNPKRIYGQSIKVSPKTPILPIGLFLQDDSGVTSDDSGVTSDDSGSHLVYTEKVQKVTHNKKSNKNQNQENNNMEKLTPDQEVSLQMLVVVGLNQEISRRLILKVWDQGQGKQYITDLLGYAALNADKNLAGFVRKMIEQNATIPTSNGNHGPGPVVKLDKYAHGGKEHKLVESSCPICHPSMVNRIEVGDEEN